LWTMARFMMTAPFLACMDINSHAAIPSKILNIGSIGPIKEFHILHCFVIGKSTKVGL